MADQSAPSEPNKGGQSTGEITPDAGGEQKQQIIMTPQQLAERLARAKPADYDEAKAKAAKFDELEAANKSDLQKADEARTAAEQDRDAARGEVLRLRVAIKHGISDEDAELFLTASDEATLTRQAEALAARSDADRKPRPPRPDPTQGRNGGAVAGSTAEQFAAAISGALNH